MGITKTQIQKEVEKVYKGQNRPVSSNDLVEILNELFKKLNKEFKRVDEILATDQKDDDNK